MYSRPITLGVAALAATSCVLGATPADARDRPFSTSRMTVRPVVDPLDTGHQLRRQWPVQHGPDRAVPLQRQRRRRVRHAQQVRWTSRATTPQPYRQDFNPDNELADRGQPEGAHAPARRGPTTTSTGSTTPPASRQAIVPTGLLHLVRRAGPAGSTDRSRCSSGNGAGDPSPAFNGKLSGDTPQTGWAMMAQLENVGGLSGPFVSQGNVSVSWSSDGGITWSEPSVAMKGQGAGIGPANQRTVLRQGVADRRQLPGLPHYGRAYLVAARYLNALQRRVRRVAGLLRLLGRRRPHLVDSRRRSPARTRCAPSRARGPTGECDEDSFPITGGGPQW